MKTVSSRALCLFKILFIFLLLFLFIGHSKWSSAEETNGNDCWELVPESQWPPPTQIDHYDYTTPVPHHTIACFYAWVEEGSYRYRQAFCRTWSPGSTGYGFLSHNEACDDLADRIDRGYTLSLGAMIDREAAKLNNSIPQYIDNDIFMELFQNDDWRPYVLSCYRDLKGWVACGDGILCNARCLTNSNLSPRYRCSHQVSILLPMNDIAIWKNVCAPPTDPDPGEPPCPAPEAD